MQMHLLSSCSARWVLLAALTLPCLFGSLSISGERVTNKEYLVKAAFINQFTTFIEWPQLSSAVNTNSYFRLCTFEGSPLISALESLVELNSIKGKKARLSVLSPPDTAENCDLVFIPPGQKGRLSEIVRGVRGQPVLTIGDSEGFAKDGVMINFYTRNEMLAFEVNLNSVDESGFVFSSRLLKLSRIVKKGE